MSLFFSILGHCTNEKRATPTGYPDYLYYKWTIQLLKLSTNIVQASEFNMYRDGVEIDYTSAVVTYSSSGSPTSLPANLLDNDINTKWVGYNLFAPRSITIQLGTAQAIDSYSYVTGDDVPDRDPVSWELYGSNDNTNWDLLDSRANQTITDTRKVETPIYSIAPTVVEEPVTPPPSGETFLSTADYYVSSSTGSDTNDGLTQETAWASLDKVNSSTFSAGQTVALKASDTFEGTLTVPSSGTTGTPIVFSAYGTGAKPKIYGSDLVTGWTLHSGNIYKATVSSEVKQLFLEGNRMTLARYPNTGYFDITTVNSSSQFTSTDLNGAVSYTGATWIGRTSAYTFYSKTVTASSSQTLTLDSAPSLSLGVGEGFILTNKLDFLDQAGEWFWDGATNTLYLWTPNGDTPANYTVRASTRDYGVSIASKSYVSIENLDLSHSGNSGVYLSAVNNITVNNNDINYPEQVGVHIPNAGSTTNTITNNSILGANFSGIRIYSPSTTVTDNTMQDIGLFTNFHKIAAGQNVGTGIFSRAGGCTINYNRIINVGYDGINFWGANTMVKYNFIDSSMAVLSDGGAIYTYNGSNVEAGASEGSEIMSNIILNTNGNKEGYTHTWDDAHGIYMDDGIRDVTVQYNTVSSTPSGGALFSHVNRNIDFRYNTVIGSSTGLLASGEHGDSYFRDNIVYATNTPGSSVWWTSSHQRMALNDSASPVYNFNKYYHHYETDNQFQSTYNFTEWKSATGQDGSSTLDSTPLGAGEVEELFYNDTKVAKDFTLTGSYRDLDGVAVSSPLTLQPFTSQILIKE